MKSYRRLEKRVKTENAEISFSVAVQALPCDISRDMSQDEATLALDYRIKRAVLFILRLVIAAGVIGFVYYARPAVRFGLDVLSPFIVALIVAYIFNPIVVLLQRRFRLGRMKGVIITYLIILAITAVFFAGLLPLVYMQGKAMVNNVIERGPEVATNVVTKLHSKFPGGDLERLKYAMETKDWDQFTTHASPAMRYLSSRAGELTRGATQVVGRALGVTVGLLGFIVFVVVISFYFLLDFARFQYVARVLLPEEREPRFFAIWKKIDHALGGLLRGQLIAAVIVGVLYSIALMLLGMKPYAILIGFVAGFGNLIPYFGPIAGGVPAGLWVLFGDRFDTGHEKIIGILLVIAIGIIVQTIDGFILQPRIVGRSAELHPLLVLLALIIGAQFGIGGLVLAVPVAVVVRVLVKELWWDPLVAREESDKARALDHSG